MAVSITMTTLNNDLARKLEPSAPSPARRLNAIKKLTSSGIICSARIDPIIPGINDNKKDLKILISQLATAGVKHITASSYKAKPDSFKRLILSFPNHKESLQKLYWKTGEYVAGSRYLPLELRLKLITIVKQITESYGMKFASCREGLETLNSSISCDSSYLI